MNANLNDLGQDETVVVLVAGALLPAASAQRIRALSPRIELIEQMSPAALKRAHVIYIDAADFDPADAPALRWVQTQNAYVWNLVDTPLGRSGVAVANVRGMFSANVAELALGMLLTLTRRLRLCEAMKASRRWPPERAEHLRFWGDGCYGKTMGVLGYGGLGRQVARIATAMGMRIMACNSQGTQTTYRGLAPAGTGDPDGALPQEWFRLDQLSQMLPRCDVVVLCLPLTRMTQHVMGDAELRLLPAHAYLVDVGAGGVLDTDALCACLERAGLAGAALDVYEREPLPSDSPLWELEDVFLAPHIGSGTETRFEFAAEVLIENLSRFLERKPLVNLVDFAMGY